MAPAPSSLEPDRVGETEASLDGRARGLEERRLALPWSGLAAVAASIVAAVDLWPKLDRGWWPWDEGTLAEPATRILNGELPHRDFADAYTGALGYIHAASFLVFGEQLSSLRLVLFVAFVLWVPAVFYIASRFLRPPEAALLTLVVVTWSVPNYTASMPSWYCTFLATFGIAALLRHLETGATRWLVAAGICGGVSLTIKIVGIYYVGAVFLYLAFKAGADGAGEGRRPGRLTWYAGAVACLGALTTAADLLLQGGHLNPSRFVSFVMPVLLVASFVAWDAYRRADPARASFRCLFSLALPFLAGVAVPLVVFATPFVVEGAAGDLLAGVWPSRRLDLAALSPPTPLTLLDVVPVVVAVLICRGVARGAVADKILVGGAIAAGAVVVVASSRQTVIYATTWESIRAALPVLAAVGAVALARRRAGDRDPAVVQRVVLLLAVASMCSLVQYPYAGPIYFAYVAPFVILAGAAVLVDVLSVWRPLLWILVGFYLAFGLVRMNGENGLTAFGYSFRPSVGMQELAAPAGLDVPAGDARVYRRIVALVERHSATGVQYMYAGPDAPELYFLTGLRNPTKSLFESLDPQPMAGSDLARDLRRHGVRVVVINRRPVVSAPLRPTVRRMLALRYPSAATVGHFTVRWRG